MHGLLLACLFSAASISVSAAPSPSAGTRARARGDLVKKSSHAQIPRDWEEIDTPVRSDHTITLQIGLKQANFDTLVNELYEVSDPKSPRYGKHLSKSEVEALVAPHPSSLSEVDAWLAEHGIDTSAVQRSPAKDWVTVTVPVGVASAIANADYKVYRNKETGAHVVRTLECSLPRSIADHIDTIQPTTFFGFKRYGKHSFSKGRLQNEDAILAAEAEAEAETAKKVASASGGPVSNATPPSSCSSTITPSCLRVLYNTALYNPVSSATNTIGVAGYLEEYAKDSDLQTFFKKYRTDAVGFTLTHVQVNGGLNNQLDPGVEANLDVQYTSGINYPTKSIYYSTGGSPPFTSDGNEPSNDNEPYLDWLNYLGNQTTIPATFTTSYGDDEQTVPLDYATRVCNTFAQIGARGSSLLFSSGDSGVGGGSCKTNDGKNAVKFIPTFPAACPFVTSVGGTYKIPEVAVSFSQGGFSNYFARPSYQSTQVASFLTAQGSTYSTYYNATGRGFPDVAAQGENFAVVVGGFTESVAGTSASSPTFAAVVSLLNDYLIGQGKPTLGFLNPWLYSTGTAGLNDITSGSNPGCGTNGFTARAGWDPVTGLGTPDFLKLQAHLP